jgi:hypothetical protein
MKTLIQATINGHNLNILCEVNKENICFPTYFIDGMEILDLDMIKPIFKAIFEALLNDFCGTTIQIYGQPKKAENLGF